MIVWVASPDKPLVGSASKLLLYPRERAITSGGNGTTLPLSGQAPAPLPPPLGVSPLQIGENRA